MSVAHAARRYRAADGEPAVRYRDTRPAPQYKMADYEYEVSRETEYTFLDDVIAATMAAPAPVTIAAAVAVVPAKPLPVVKSAPVAAVARPAPAVAPQAAPSKIAGPRLQKLATRQIAVGLYTFNHAGMVGVVKNTAEGWQLIINDVAGNRRYETKRHAVNAARIKMEQFAAAPATAPQAKPAAVARPAATAPAPVAAPPAPRVNWKSQEAPWRRERMTSKQASLLGHLGGKMEKCGLTATSPLASQAGLNRGQASDLIDSLKSQLGGYARAPRAAGQTAVEGCSIGPFAGGFCTICGLIEGIGR